jgi:hypothetical protein
MENRDRLSRIRETRRSYDENDKLAESAWDGRKSCGMGSRRRSNYCDREKLLPKHDGLSQLNNLFLSRYTFHTIKSSMSQFKTNLVFTSHQEKAA